MELHRSHFLLTDHDLWMPLALSGWALPRQVTDCLGAEFLGPGSSMGPHVGPKPLISQSSLQIDGVHQRCPEERGVHTVGGGKAVRMQVP